MQATRTDRTPKTFHETRNTDACARKWDTTAHWLPRSLPSDCFSHASLPVGARVDGPPAAAPAWPPSAAGLVFLLCGWKCQHGCKSKAACVKNENTLRIRTCTWHRMRKRQRVRENGRKRCFKTRVLSPRNPAARKQPGKKNTELKSSPGGGNIDRSMPAFQVSNMFEEFHPCLEQSLSVAWGTGLAETLDTSLPAKLTFAEVCSSFGSVPARRPEESGPEAVVVVGVGVLLRPRAGAAVAVAALAAGPGGLPPCCLQRRTQQWEKAGTESAINLLCLMFHVRFLQTAVAVFLGADTDGIVRKKLKKQVPCRRMFESSRSAKSRSFVNDASIKLKLTSRLRSATLRTVWA